MCARECVWKRDRGAPPTGSGHSLIPFHQASSPPGSWTLVHVPSGLQTNQARNLIHVTEQALFFFSLLMRGLQKVHRVIKLRYEFILVQINPLKIHMYFFFKHTFSINFQRRFIQFTCFFHVYERETDTQNPDRVLSHYNPAHILPVHQDHRKAGCTLHIQVDLRSEPWAFPCDSSIMQWYPTAYIHCSSPLIKFYLWTIKVEFHIISTCHKYYYSFG